MLKKQYVFYAVRGMNAIKILNLEFSSVLVHAVYAGADFSPRKGFAERY